MQAGGNISIYSVFNHFSTVNRNVQLVVTEKLTEYEKIFSSNTQSD